MKRARENLDDLERAARNLMLMRYKSQLLEETKKLMEEYPKVYKIGINTPERLLTQVTELVGAITSFDPDELYNSIYNIRLSHLHIPYDKFLSFLTKVSTNYDRSISEKSLADVAKIISTDDSETFLQMLINASAIKYGSALKGLTYLAVKSYLGKFSPKIQDAILSKFDRAISEFIDPEREKNEIANYMKDFAKECPFNLSDSILKIHKKILQLTDDISIVDDVISWHREAADFQVQQAMLLIKQITLKNNDSLLNNDFKIFCNIRFISRLLLLPDEEKIKYKMKISEAALNYAKEIFTSQTFVQALYAARTKCLKKFKNPQKDKDIVDQLIRIKIAEGRGYENLKSKSKLSDTIISDLEWFVWKLKNQDSFVLDAQLKMYIRYHFIIISLKFSEHIKDDLNIFNKYIQHNKGISEQGFLSELINKIYHTFPGENFAKEAYSFLSKIQVRHHTYYCVTCTECPQQIFLNRINGLVGYHIKNEIFESKASIFYEPDMLENQDVSYPKVMGGDYDVSHF